MFGSPFQLVSNLKDNSFGPSPKKLPEENVGEAPEVVYHNLCQVPEGKVRVGSIVKALVV